MDKKEKQKLIHSIIFNSVLILLLLLFLGLYLVPWHADYSQKTVEANELYQSYNKLKYNGIEINDLQRIFAKHSSNKAIKDSLKDKDKLVNILKKNNSSLEYMTWINNELAKQAQFNQEIKNNEAILWNILPVFYQYWNSYNSESTQIQYQITLENFTSFVENDILKQYDIDSYSPIGIDNITFDKSGPKNNINESIINDTNNWGVSSIWSFVLDIDFQAKNSQISQMIEYIQNSWKLYIQNWKLVNTVKKSDIDSNYSSLNNLLMSIDSLNLSDTLSNPNSTNKGIMKIRFYVRWMWLEQLTNIKTKVMEKIAKLEADMNNKSRLCDKEVIPLCKESAWSEAVANIRDLLKELSLIRQRINAKTKSATNTNIDINVELSDWLSILTWLTTIESSYSKPANYINNFKLAWAK